MTGPIRLEPLGRRHCADVAELLKDPETLRYTRIPEPSPEGFAEDWIARYEAGRRDGSRAGFAALDEGGAFVGMALVPTIDEAEGEAELGYIVAPPVRGHGVGTAILRSLTRWTFEETGVHRIRLVISEDNVASERVAERAGYVREGLMRSIHLKQGIRENASLWSRLRTDPEPL